MLGQLFDQMAAAGGQQLASRSFEHVLYSANSALLREASIGPGVFHDAVAMQRVQAALEAADQPALVGSLRTQAAAYIGSDKPFLTQREFEFQRFMYPGPTLEAAGDFAQSLESPQLPQQMKAALNAIRESVPYFNKDEVVVRVITEADALQMLASGDPLLKGFVSGQQNLTGVNAIEDVSKRFGLYYPGSPYAPGAKFAVIRTKVTQAMVDQHAFGIPRNDGFSNGHALEVIIRDREDQPLRFPFTGDGFMASLDGWFGDEWIVRDSNGIRMNADPDATTIELCEGALDTLAPAVTIGGQTSSRWKLTQIAPDQWRWVPVTGP